MSKLSLGVLITLVTVMSSQAEAQLVRNGFNRILNRPVIRGMQVYYQPCCVEQFVEFVPYSTVVESNFQYEDTYAIVDSGFETSYVTPSFEGMGCGGSVVMTNTMETQGNALMSNEAIGTTTSSENSMPMNGEIVEAPAQQHSVARPVYNEHSPSAIVEPVADDAPLETIVTEPVLDSEPILDSDSIDSGIPANDDIDADDVDDLDAIEPAGLDQDDIDRDGDT